MSNDELKNTLKELHHRLDSAGGTIDTELKSLLQVLDQDIDQLLNKEPQETSEENALATRAQELSAKFAAQHPQLEGALRELGRVLESMGI